MRLGAKQVVERQAKRFASPLIVVWPLSISSPHHSVIWFEFQ
jgi:hypothetical protein